MFIPVVFIVIISADLSMSHNGVVVTNK